MPDLALRPGPADVAGVGDARVQRLIQSGVIARTLDAKKPFRASLALRLLDAVPALQALPARLIGVGVRREHVA